METANKRSYFIQFIYLLSAAFFGLVSYPLTRTSAAPYFNEAFGSENLSYAMIASALLAVLVVTIYNRLAKRFKLIPLCIGAMLTIIAITITFGFIMGHHPKWMALLYYAWSDVYILILVEQFWSISNTIFDKKSAKKYYGVLLTGGSLGSLVGNALVTKLVEPLGADNMIFLCALFLGLFVLFIALFNKSISKDSELKAKFRIEKDLAEHSKAGGASLLISNKYILLIAFLVMSVQLYINSVYFIFNRYLDANIHHVNMQSALYGKAFLIIQIVTIVMSVVITPLALKFLDVAKTHYAILLTTLGLLIAALINPSLTLVGLLFVASKSFDYSIFRAAKEMFYLPLHVAEKFQAKAFIDIFGYRLSKAIAAVAILLIGRVFKLNLFFLVAFSLTLWITITILILIRYKKIDK